MLFLWACFCLLNKVKLRRPFWSRAISTGTMMCKIALWDCFADYFWSSFLRNLTVEKKLNKQSHSAIRHNIGRVSISISKWPMKEIFFLKLYIAVVNCSALTPPANGTVSPPSCLSRSTYGQTCSFSCNTPGYVLEGTSARVCDKNGEWTGNKNTFCRGIEYFLH